MLDYPEDRGVLDRFAFFVARMAPLTLVLVAVATLVVGVGIGFTVGRLAQGDKVAPPAPTALAAITPLPAAPPVGDAAHQYQ
ncbi:hypothetical protein CKO38_04810, partial [Rhodospirillum rubrum]|nr:hypothetical protein [Rhodospirillum rubrum]